MRSLTSARKTRELWAASYMFSWLMKQVARELRADEKREFFTILTDKGDSSTIYHDFHERHTYTQAGQGDYAEKALHGVGLFPDRLIYKCPADEKLEDIQSLFQKHVKALAEDMADVTMRSGGKGEAAYVQQVEEYLFDYLNVHFVKKELADDQAPLPEINAILDALEQQQTFATEFHPCILEYLSAASLREPPSKLAFEAFGDRRSLDQKTIEHLAVASFLPEGEPTEKDLKPGILIERFQKANPDEFLPAHKYVAIVHADGDRVGRTMESFIHSQQAQDFLAPLMDFAKEAARLIDGYGGLPVYAGGDDLLFFAPVLNIQSRHDCKNIFSLLKALDKLYMEKMEGKGAGDVQTSLSFGVSITYYKFPLYESLGRTFELEKLAKNSGRHRIAYEIRKHSGSTFGSMLQLDGRNAVTDAFQKLLDTLFQEDNKRVLSSVAYKLRQEQELLKHFGADSDRVASYINNSFNEGIHKQANPREFLNHMKALIPAVYQQAEHAGASKEKANEQLFGMLRSLQFLTENPNG